jgi:hypothetical protein
MAQRRGGSMKHWMAGLVAVAAVLAFVPIAGAKKPLSDGQIRQILIDESIAAYSGNCPCPYSTARNGSRCGKRSAYSRPGGEAPLCYPKDVTAEMVQAYRDAHPES